MASRRRRPGAPEPGDGPRNPLTDRDPLNNPLVPRERRRGGGLGSFYGEVPTDPMSPSNPPRDRGYNIFAPSEGPPKPTRRAKPGLGRGLEDVFERINRERESLKSPGIDDLFRDTSKGGEEPPDDYVPDGYDPEALPLPEYIEPILQAERPSDMSADEARFAVKRPDLDSRFYGQGSTKSTRVHAIQWIPTHRSESGMVYGDIFVAFARPQRGKSGLFLYTDKSAETWTNFKNSSSLGRYVNKLGTPETQDALDSELFAFYKSKHPIYSTWIFEEMARWNTIRPGNALGGDDAKTAAEVAESVEADPTLAKIKARRAAKKRL